MDQRAGREMNLLDLFRRDREDAAPAPDDEWNRGGFERKDWSQASAREVRQGARAFLDAQAPGTAGALAAEQLALRALDHGMRLATLGLDRDPAGPHPARAMVEAAHWPDNDDNFVSALTARANNAGVRLSDHPNYHWSDTSVAQRARKRPEWELSGVADETDIERGFALMGGLADKGIFVSTESMSSFFAKRPAERVQALRGLARGIKALGDAMRPGDELVATRLSVAGRLAQIAQGGSRDPELCAERDHFDQLWHQAGARCVEIRKVHERNQKVEQAWGEALNAAFEVDEPAIALALLPAMSAAGQIVGDSASRAVKARAPGCVRALIQAGWGIDELDAADVALALSKGAGAKGESQPLWLAAIESMSKELIGKASDPVATVAELEAQVAGSLVNAEGARELAWAERALLDLSFQWRAQASELSGGATSKHLGPGRGARL
jgi:hypothetical protein